MEIRVPQLAEGVTSGTVVSIAVKAGDSVKKDQPLLELETNKAIASITSEGEGTVTQVLVKEGDQVSVGQVLLRIGSGAGASESAPTQVPSMPEPAKVQVPKALRPRPEVRPEESLPVFENYEYESAAGLPPPASPTVRRLARDLGIDLARVQGSEAGGRISLADLRSYIANLQQVVFSDPKREARMNQGPAEKKPVSIDFTKWGPVTKKPLTPIRRAISEAMTASWTTIPHVTQFDDLEIELAMKLRKKFEKDYAQAGTKLTLTSFVIKAVVTALKKYPILNASLDEVAQQIVLKDYVHIGIAVDTEHGLMVPVLRDADKKSFLEISRELEQLAEKARQRKISIEEMQGGTFTISNQGGIGGKHFTPIINKPEAAILGVGRGYQAPVARKEGVVTTWLMPVGLSYDHRVIDGGTAARFVVALAEAMKGFTEEDLRGEQKG